MTTPVLFLDDASRHVGAADRAQALQTTMTLLETLKRLRKINKRIALNTAGPIAQHKIADDWTLQSILGGVVYKEEWEFIRSLNDRSPFSAGLKDSLLQEVGGMEFRTRPGQVVSSALAWATLLDSATVGFSAHPDWSRAWVETAYCLMADDGSICEAEGRVRNASRAVHADEHGAWLRSLGLSKGASAAQVWVERADRFPGLRFLPRTEGDLVMLEGSGAPFFQAMSALDTLAKDASSWKPESSWPEFSTKASPEFEHRQKLCWATDDVTGKKELFDWHTRFTGGLAGRVHFRVDSERRSIVIAYIGGKLSREISG